MRNYSVGTRLKASVVVIVFLVFSLSLFLVFFVSPLYGIQSYDEQTVCDQTDRLLNLDGKSYEEAKRFSTNPSGMIERYEITSLTDEQLYAINNCGYANLPSLVSIILEKRVGFFEGLNNHLATGKVSVIEIESGNYLRFVDYEIKYVPNPHSSTTVPEFHVYLRLGDEENYEDKYLEKLKEKVGAKNYVVSDEYLDDLHSVIIKNVAVNNDKSKNYTDFEIVAVAMMDEKSTWLTPVSWFFEKQFDSVIHPTSHSKMIYEKTGRFEGIGDVQAKGNLHASFEEDNADIVIESFEITNGYDLNLYLTKDGAAKHPSGGWEFDPYDNLVYVSNTNNDEILRYSALDGTFVDFFTSEGPLNGPRNLMLSVDGKHLYVINTDNKILRYNTSDGTFVDFFTSETPIIDATLSTDGKHLYVINTDNKILRYNTSDGTFVDFFTSETPIIDATLSTDGKHLYVINTDNKILRYNTSDGTFVDFFTSEVPSHGPKDLLLSDDEKYLYVSNHFTNEISRFEIETKEASLFASPHDGQIDEPSSMYFGPESKLWVTSTGTNSLLQFDSNTGLFLSATKLSESAEKHLNRPIGLTMGPYCENSVHYEESGYTDDCTIFVSDSGNNRILKYNGDSKQLEPFISSLSSTSPEHIEFGPPTCSKQMGDCFLFVSFPDIDQIHKYDVNDGTFKGDFLKKREAKAPHSFTFGPDGSLYVSSWKTDEILKYDADGKFDYDENPFSTGGGLNGPRGIAFVSIGNDDELKLFVTSEETHDVLQYNGTSGSLLDIYDDGRKKFIERDITGMVQPTDIKYYEGFLYVLSQKTDEIFKYDTSGKFVKKLVSDKSNGLIKPDTLGFVDDDICVSSAYTNSVLCYDEKNQEFEKKLVISFNQKFDTPKFSEIGGLDSELYISHPLFNEVNRYETISGLFVDTLISGEQTLLQGPRYIAMHNGSIFVSSANNNEVIRYDGTTGDFIEVFVKPDSGSLDSPHGLAFDDNGYLYVSSNDNYRVLRYDSNGGFVDDFIPSRTGGLKEPRGLLYDNGYLYVSSFVGNNVMKFDIATKEFDLYPVPGPEGLALSDDGLLYVASSVTNQIYEINPTLPAKSLEELIPLEKTDGPDFIQPKGITFVKDKLYVSNYDNDQVIKYNLKTKKTSFEPGLVARSTLINPYGLLYDEKQEDLFIASVYLHRILKLDLADDVDLDSQFDKNLAKKIWDLTIPLT